MGFNSVFKGLKVREMGCCFRWV